MDWRCVAVMWEEQSSGLREKMNVEHSTSNIERRMTTDL